MYDLLQSVAAMFSEKTLALADSGPFVDYLSKVREFNNAAIEQAPTNSQKNSRHLIYIQMESVDGISIRSRHKGEPIMPFLYHLRNRSIVFPNTIDNTSAGRSSDGEFMTLTSLPPVIGKPIYSNYDLSRIPSMPRVLNEAGYYSFSMHGFSGYFWNRRAAHQQLGYNDTFFLSDLDASDKIGWGISDYSVLKQAGEKIIASNRPVFAHIILLTNHHPYHHVGRKFGREKATIVENHIDSLRYVDHSIRTFFEQLDQAGELDNSVIAIYGDHDSGIAHLLVNSIEVDGPFATADSVPLMLFGTGHRSRIIERIGSLLDLPVMALGSLGIIPPHTFAGNAADSSLPTLTPRHTLIELRSGAVHEAPAPIDAGILTKMAILHPEKLQRDE